MPETEILLSVLMPVRNEGKHLQQTLKALRGQDVDSFEVLLADGSSEDDTLAIARRMCDSFPQLMIFHNPGLFSSAGRNAGLQYARGKYVIVIDGHCRVPDAGYLRRVVEEFERSGAAMLGRPQPLEHRSKLGEAIVLARRSRLGHNPDSAIYSDESAWMPGENVAVAYRREVFVQVGVFDERFDACEDVEFNRRCDAAGFKCWFTPRIVLPYAARETLRGLWRQMVRYGTGRARLAMVRRAATLPALAPSALLLYLASLPFLMMGSAWFAVPLIAWLLAIAWESRRDPLRMPFVFAAIHIGFGWGFLRGLFSITIRMVIHGVTGAAARPGSPARYRRSSSPPLPLRRTG